MRIAFISFEYPADSHYGGIATYVKQAAEMFTEMGHSVEVFSSSPFKGSSEMQEEVFVHRIKLENNKSDHHQFRALIVEKFTERHSKIPFDIVETPEYFAEGMDIKKAFPLLPMVVKFHTPTFLLEEMYYGKVTFARKCKYYKNYLLYDIRYGKQFEPFWKYNKSKDPEFIFTSKYADGYCTPSADLGRIIAERWSINRSDIINLPNLFVPSIQMLQIPVENRRSKENVIVTFVGRLETRKGIYTLIDAIPLVLAKHPDVIFRFMGAAQESIVKGLDVGMYLLNKLSEYKNSLQLLGKITYDELPKYLEDTDICVFPSLWENFPNVCLEAMCAGRAVVGSKAGGMADMIVHKTSGLLCNPNDINDLANSISWLIENTQARINMGINARKKVLEAYNKEVIYNKTIQFYKKVIQDKI